jgi:hypothetical protein
LPDGRWIGIVLERGDAHDLTVFDVDVVDAPVCRCEQSTSSCSASSAG